jgi:hypothetical protein
MIIRCWSHEARRRKDRTTRYAPSKLARTLSGAAHKEQPGSVQTCVRSSPAQPCAILFHPPDPPIASNRFPSDVRFAQASTAYINGPSKLSLLPSRNGMHVVPTAPVEGAPPLISQFDWSRVRAPEHRNDMRVVPSLLVYASGEQLETNRFLRPSFGLPLREHRSDRRVLPPIPSQTLAEPSRPKAQ